MVRELPDDLVLIGEISKAHGIRGEVKAYLYSGQPGNFKNYKTVVLQEPDEDRIEKYNLVKSRTQDKQAILQLDGVETREGAEALQGYKILLAKTELPGLAPGEYYWHQLEGLQVITETGSELGKVIKLFNTPAHDIMVVAGDAGEKMIPVKGGIIKEIDAQGGKVIISPPQGLLEMNE